MDLKEFSVPYTKLCFSFNQQIQQGQLLAYFEQLNMFDVEKLKEACWNLARTSTFFPKIAEIIDEIKSVQLKPNLVYKQLENKETIPQQEEVRKMIKDLIKTLDDKWI